jgi:hypothetical protein
MHVLPVHLYADWIEDIYPALLWNQWRTTFIVDFWCLCRIAVFGIMSHAYTTLEAIANNFREVMRMMSTDPASKPQCLQKIAQCIAALGSISTVISIEHYDAIHSSLLTLQTELNSADYQSSTRSAQKAYTAAHVQSGKYIIVN